MACMPNLYPYPFRVLVMPGRHVIQQYGLQIDSDRLDVTIDGPAVVTETLWLNLTYSTEFQRHLKHGDVLYLQMAYGSQRIELAGVVDLYDNYQCRITCGGQRFWCDFHSASQAPITHCDWRILFKERLA